MRTSDRVRRERDRDAPESSSRSDADVADASRASSRSGGVSATESIVSPVRETGETERQVLDAASEAQVTLVIGESDTGKTSLVTRLANGLHARGLTVAVVDADLGQSEIGPPTTIGLGRVTRPLARLSDADVLALRFVGVTSPARDALAAVTGTRLLVDRARRLGFEKIVIDTSGLVRGDIGRRLKQAKIDVLGPDLIVALQRAGECEPILHAYAPASRPRVLRLPGFVPVRRRTPDDRRRHRERALAAHLSGARAITLDLSRVVLRTPALFIGTPIGAEALRTVDGALETEIVWAESRAGELVVVSPALGELRLKAMGRALGAVTVMHHDVEDLVHVLAGLDDASLDTVGLGVITAIDFTARRMTVVTAVPPGRVASVSIGRERYRAFGPPPTDVTAGGGSA
jgi:polynucleotide 5'-hydroxyl-kinase GRC3/NOL9